MPEGGRPVMSHKGALHCVFMLTEKRPDRGSVHKLHLVYLEHFQLDNDDSTHTALSYCSMSAL